MSTLLDRPRRILRRQRQRPWASHVAPAVWSWAVARVVVAVGFVAAVVAADELAEERPLPLRQGLLAWDGAWYDEIATDGYDHLAPDSLRFFPLLPVLGRIAGALLPGGPEVGLVVIANIAAVALGLLLHRLVRDEGGDTALAARTVWLVALFPASFVLVFAYAEAPAMALAVGTFVALRGGRWGWAAATGLLAALCRPVGVLLAIPAAIEAGRGLRAASWRQRGARVGAVLGPLAGMASYLAWVGIRFDDALAPIRAHETGDLRGGYVLPPVRVVRAVADLFGGEALGAGLHVPFIALFLVLLVVCFRRLPVSYGAYAAAVLFVALSAESLGSFERYALSAFPLLMALAAVTVRPAHERTVLALAGASLMGFTTLTLLGVFVP